MAPGRAGLDPGQDRPRPDRSSRVLRGRRADAHDRPRRRAGGERRASARFPLDAAEPGGAGRWSARSTERSATRSPSAATRWRCRWRSAAAAASSGSTRHELAAAYPHAKPRLAVFVHGLCETDDAWTGYPPAPRATSPTATGWRSSSATARCTSATTPAGTSPRTAASSRELLERLVAAWPVARGRGRADRPLDGRAGRAERVPLRRRQRVHRARSATWSRSGRPHRGAPLEQVTNAASAALARLPETRPLARPLNIRSSGIKDLRYGYLVDECWLDQDCDAYLRDTSREIPFLPTARHYFICATLSREPDAAVGRIIGDLLVLQPSAWAHPERGDADALPDRALLPSRRRQPLRPSQPPGDLRADPPVRAEPARVAGASSRWPGDLAAVTLAPEHELLGQRGARRRRGIGEHRDGLGDARGDGRDRAVGSDRHVLAIVGRNYPSSPGSIPASLR